MDFSESIHSSIRQAVDKTLKNKCALHDILIGVELASAQAKERIKEMHSYKLLVAASEYHTQGKKHVCEMAKCAIEIINDFGSNEYETHMAYLNMLTDNYSREVDCMDYDNAITSVFLKEYALLNDRPIKKFRDCIGWWLYEDHK